MKDNVKLYRTIMALTLALCMMIVSMVGYAPDAFLTFAEAAEAEDSEAKLEAREATPALATEERSGIFEDAEISRMIDENYQKVLEDGYAELRIPMSLHGITEDALIGNSLEVGRKLLENGFEAYVIGGCMRDFIMGTQSVDIDIVTNASLEQQRELFGDALETHISGGRVFGGVVFPDETVDLATYQNVPASFYGLRGVPDFDPSTEISDSPLLDSFQRDLTINAIYYDMSNGDLVDYHGGIHDIREHVLNTMVNPLNALTEDPRILVRSIRFKARYGFDFSEALDSVIRERGVDLLNAIDRYDLYSNISKMMVAGYSSAAWPVLMDSELLDTVYPPLIRLVDKEDYAAYLRQALAYMDQLCQSSGEDNSKALALLAFLQPEIDRRAERSGYETALCGVLDEQETAFDLTKIRTQLEEVSLLAHDMEQVSSRFLRDAVQSSEYYEDALALLNMKALAYSSLTRQAAFWNETAEQAEENSDERPDAATVPEGVVPVTWEVTPEHPMIDTDEARALYQQIAAGDYPTMEELLANPVVQQLDALSAYYKSIYGNTADIDTPEREALREALKDWFLTLGSARTDSVDENGKHHYVYDGPLNRDYQMILALGLPASGKSTFIADPDSEAMGAFILDVDVIKAQIPEYVESHGAASDSIHFEGMGIFDRAISEFLTGDMQGVNIVLPIVGGDFDEMMQQYVLPFEAAGYNVKVKFRPAKENEAAARVVMRELGGGQLITSAVAFNFGEGPENVYNRMKDMINAKGEPYGFVEDEEEALEPAA